MFNFYFSNIQHKDDPSTFEEMMSKSEVVYPALLLSLILNLVTGGFVLKVFGPILRNLLGKTTFNSIC